MGKYSIFISYRRDGGEALACLMSERLKRREYKVFYDVESLRSGKFNEEIYNMISQCQDVIVILPQNGLDRCGDPEDWVRKEIAYAIEKKKNIIPVMMRNFEFPKELPDDIRELPNYQGINASDMTYFEAIFDKLITMLTSGKTLHEDKVLKYVKDQELYNEIQGLIKENSKEAKYQLAEIYLSKLKKKELNEESFRLCTESAEDGYVPAKSLLGFLYERGIGTECNVVKAFEWYKAAADEEYAQAQYFLSKLLRSHSWELSAYWLEKAREQEYFLALERATKTVNGMFVNIIPENRTYQETMVRLDWDYDEEDDDEYDGEYGEGLRGFLKGVWKIFTE